MKITEDMITVLNMECEKQGLAFRFNINTKEINPSVEIILPCMAYVDGFIINLSKNYYEYLEKFFAKRGIELRYNNIGSIFWSKDGWKE